MKISSTKRTGLQHFASCALASLWNTSMASYTYTSTFVASMVLIKPVTFMEPFHSTKGSFYFKMLVTLRKMVLLRTVQHWKVLWGTKNASSMASLKKYPFRTVVFKRVCFCISKIMSKNCTLKKKSYCSDGSCKTFNIYGTVPFHRRFFIVEKSTSDFFNVLHTKKIGSAVTSLWKQLHFYECWYVKMVC